MEEKEYTENTTNLLNLLLDRVASLYDYGSFIEVAASNIAGGNWETEARLLLLFADNVWYQRNEHFKTMQYPTDLKPEDFVDSILLPNI